MRHALLFTRCNQQLALLRLYRRSVQLHLHQRHLQQACSAASVAFEHRGPQPCGYAIALRLLQCPPHTTARLLGHAQCKQQVRLLSSSGGAGGDLPGQQQQPATQPDAAGGQKPGSNALAPKPPLLTRIWHEVVHYWNGFRLLLLEIRIASRIGFKYLRGKPITRREKRHFVRTVADLFRMLPFIVFIVVPFMELLLPLYLKFLPFMLPSTFQEKDKEAEKLRLRLKVKLETAKFLQATLQEGIHLKSDTSEARQSLADFRNFMEKCSTAGRYASTDELVRFSRLFADELTLGSLERPQLAAICKLLEVPAVGPKALIELQLEIRLRRLHADDQLIQTEGLDKLNVAELQAACRARGMRSLGLSEERLKQQLTQWLDLHLNCKVPTSLLLLSRSLHFPDSLEPEDLLRKTIAALPQQTVASVVANTGADNKAKLEALKSADRVVAKEAREAAEASKAASAAEAIRDPAAVEGVGSSDLRQLKSAIGQLAGERLLQDQELRDLKESRKAADLAAGESLVAAAAAAVATDDSQTSQQTVASSTAATAAPAPPSTPADKAAALLDAKLGRLVGEIDGMMEKVQLEREALERKLKEDLAEDTTGQLKEQLLSLNDLQLALKRFQRKPDDDRWEKILPLLDEDNDGKIELHHVTRVVELLGSDHLRLSSADLAKLLEALDKERLVLASKDSSSTEAAAAQKLAQKASSTVEANST